MTTGAEPKPVSASHVTLTQLMEITDANVAGNVHGGVVMRLADTAAALAAIRHAEGLCVTVSVDEVSFLAPVHVGDVVSLRASVNDVGTTSLECGVRVEAENPISGSERPRGYRVFRVRGARRRRPAASGPPDRGRDRDRAAPPARRQAASRGADATQGGARRARRRLTAVRLTGRHRPVGGWKQPHHREGRP